MKVLIIGFGSIGSRHYENFKSLGCQVEVVSKRSQAFETYKTVNEAMQVFKPSHVVIANETSAHEDTLNEVLEFSFIEKILVEKPLYSFLPKNFPASAHAKVAVAFNFRFHPMIQELKQKITGQKIIGSIFYVGQDLTTWRPDRDYRQVYSSKKSEGGGVLRDLSHELDMFQFLTGEPCLISAHGGHYSNLESDAEDTYSVILKSKECPSGIIQMNCVDKIGQRFLILHTENDSYLLNLVSGTWRDSKSETVFKFDRNKSYMEMSQAFLRNDDRICSFKDGLVVNKLIEAIEGLK